MPDMMLSGLPQLRTDGGRYVIDVEWDDVDNLQDFLRRYDIRTTAYQDLDSRSAALVLWDGEDADDARTALSAWDG
jgi:hypothetical protein